jgi:hypothetical protein
MNNDQQTLGKSVLVNRINSIANLMKTSREVYNASPKRKRDNNNKYPLETLEDNMRFVQEELELLYRDVKENLATETTIDREYNKETFEATLRSVRNKVLQRFQGFPMAAALLECFIMLIESDLTLNAHFLNLRKQAGVEDRVNNGNQLYNLDGQPKN